MNILDKLVQNSKNETTLSLMLKNDLSEIYDFFLVKEYSYLSQYKGRIESYISQHLRVIKKLNFSDERVQVFLIILLDVSERFGDLFWFNRLYKLAARKNIVINKRIKAAALFLTDIGRVNDYERILDTFLSNLKEAYTEEEDNIDRVLSTFLNYYANLVRNFGKQNTSGVAEIRTKIISKSKEIDYSFLSHPLVTRSFSFNVNENEKTYHEIHKLLDTFLKRVLLFKEFNTDKLLLEENTSYTSSLENVSSDFLSIRQISVNSYHELSDENIFYTLQRGVKILEEEKQLFAYMYSYGKMHNRKLQSSFSYLPQSLEVNSIIDWGCGQALATMCFLDYLNKQGVSFSAINLITLIEPSEIALKRGAAHTLRYNSAFNINTINKKLNELSRNDFVIEESSNVKFHLFSNILDIDSFSMSNLVKVIEETFSGINYFICVSPYISLLKTNRLNQFMNYFKDKPNYNTIKIIDNSKGEWVKNWTRVVRIFKVEL